MRAYALILAYALKTLRTYDLALTCLACQEKVNYVDYKRADILRKFVSAQFKIMSTVRTGLCNKHQRMVANAVKNARYMAMLPYTKLQTIKR